MEKIHFQINTGNQITSCVTRTEHWRLRSAKKAIFIQIVGNVIRALTEVRHQILSESQRKKTYLRACHVRPGKIQINLCIRAVRSDYSLGGI